jgi:hypothetical protein
MKDEDEKYFLETYPNLYRQHKLPMTQTCLCWGFNCGSGWRTIIDNLSKKITELDPDVQASQVKEKFGGLRFYIDGGSDEVHKLIEKAEEESYKTCEKCGTKENVSVTKTGWIITLCDKCRKERNKEE